MNISNNFPHHFHRTNSHYFTYVLISIRFLVSDDFSHYYKNRKTKERETNSYLSPALKDTDDVLHVLQLCTNVPIPTQCSRAFLLSLYFVFCRIENNLH